MCITITDPQPYIPKKKVFNRTNMEKHKSISIFVESLLSEEYIKVYKTGTVAFNVMRVVSVCLVSFKNVTENSAQTVVPL